jgi:hypothetical protein
MVCRHKPGDPNCSKSPEGRLREQAYLQELRNSDARQYEKTVKYYQERIAELEKKLKEWEGLAGNNYGDYAILDDHWENGHLILVIQYPSCQNCSFESKKILVFKVENPKDVMYWRKIDPHFRETPPKNKNEAPSPLARFPASDHGWAHAIAFVRSLQEGV